MSLEAVPLANILKMFIQVHINGKIASVAEARLMVAYGLAQGWLPPEAA